MHKGLHEKVFLKEHVVHLAGDLDIVSYMLFYTLQSVSDVVDVLL